MRTPLRTILITMVIVFSGLIVWSFVRNANSAQSTQAAPATPTIPEHCVKDLQEWLAKHRSPQERQTAVQAELQCAADAQGYAARKGTALAKFTPPAPWRTRRPVTPRPTAIIQVGLQNGDFNPYTQDPFLAVDNGNNLWVGIINDKVVSVFAGYLNNEQENEDWQTQPGWVAHGAVWVCVSDWKNGGVIYPTITRHGEVHFIAACGAMLFLEGTDETVFAFDAAKQAYVSNTFISCPTVTP